MATTPAPEPPRVVASPAARAAERAWRPRDAHVAISVERVLSFDAVTVNSTHDDPGDGTHADHTTTRSTFPFGGYRGGAPRLAVDVLFGATVGAYIGYSNQTDHFVTYDPMSGTTDPGSYNDTGGVVGVRAGAIIGRGSAVALWLRGGVGYQWTAQTPPTGDQDGSSSTEVFVAIDPVLIVAPIAHVALTVGPYLEGAAGSETARMMGVTAPGVHTYLNMVLGLTANLAVLF